MKIGRVEKILMALSATVILVSLAFATANVRPAADRVVVLKTLGMTCGSCAGKIEQALLQQSGVAKVTVNVEAAQVVVVFDAKAVTPEQLAAAVTSVGFTSAVAQNLSVQEFMGQAAQKPSMQASGKGCGSPCCN